MKMGKETGSNNVPLPFSKSSDFVVDTRPIKLRFRKVPLYCVFVTVFARFSPASENKLRRKKEKRSRLPVDGSPQYELHSTRNVITMWSLSRKPAEYMLLVASCLNIFIHNSKLTSFTLSVSRNVLAELTWCRESLLVLLSRLPWSRLFLLNP